MISYNILFLLLIKFQLLIGIDKQEVFDSTIFSVSFASLLRSAFDRLFFSFFPNTVSRNYCFILCTQEREGFSD